MRRRLAALADLADRTALKFGFERDGREVTGILVNHGGTIVAWLNRCRHRPFPLDWDDGRFYTRDREFFICATHGAVYEPASGLCVLGPCAGESLEPLAITVEDGAVWFEPDCSP